ncbi:MAG TPA: hypothetical protein VJB67_03380 [Patescibacteria group bacterium]|nr:hypothetical protein [Patescibacteria group bacterium]
MFKKKIDSNLLIKKGILAGILEVIFISLVAGFFMIADSFFPADSGNIILNIMAVLSLLVIGVGVSGILVLGLPLYYFTQKKYQEGIVALGVTLGTILVIFILISLIEIFVF